MLSLTIAFAVIFLLGCVVLFVHANKWRAYVKAINRLPGPTIFESFFLAWEIASTSRFERYKIAERHLKDHGRIFTAWLGLKPIVYIAEPDGAMAILNSSKNINKTFAYKFFYPWLGTGLLTANGHKWHSRRKILTPAFHFSILQNFFNTMVNHSKKLVNTLEKELESERFNICPYISNATLDIICETAMGVKLDKEVDVSAYRNSIRRINELILYRCYSPWLWLDSLHKMTHKYKDQEEHLKLLHGFCSHVLEKRKDERKNRPEIRVKFSNTDDDETKPKSAFLDSLLEIAESGDAELTDAEIKDEVNTFMFEGHDTVSALIMWSIFCLGIYPEYQTKLHEELHTMFGDSDRDPTQHNINQLTYLDMVVKETLRICPSVPLISRSLVEDVEFDGHRIPAGTAVAISIFRLHRHPEQFPYPEKFNPDNFLPENVLRRHHYAYLPFSAGPRNCIGQRFGLMEAKVVLSTLIRHYEFETLVKIEDMKVSTESVLYPESGVIVKMRKRDRNNSILF